jgi:hypothetical protein
MSDQPENRSRRTFSEELEVAGNQVVGRVQELVKEGNVRRLIIRNPEDQVLLEMPLTIGAVGVGAIAVAAPWLAALGAFAALAARVKIEVVREVADAEIGDVQVNINKEE